MTHPDVRPMPGHGHNLFGSGAYREFPQPHWDSRAGKRRENIRHHAVRIHSTGASSCTCSTARQRLPSSSVAPAGLVRRITSGARGNVSDGSGKGQTVRSLFPLRAYAALDRQQRATGQFLA
jgi:hypothetical protein